MGQEYVSMDKVKGGQNLSKMNLIVKRIESELDQLKNLINLQIYGLTTASPSTNCDGNCDFPIDTTAEYVDKVSHSNSNYQYEFNNEDQEVDCQNRPSNEDELILGGVDFNCEMPSKENETHVDLLQSSTYFTSFQNQDKVLINQLFVDSVDLKPDVVDSFQISNENRLEGLILERAGKNDQKLSQKVTVQMGVRCDKNPTILNSYRAKISHTAGNIIRPFKCKICSKSFTSMGNLKIHSRLHTGEKPYSCSICLKQFTQIHSRNRHMSTHTGEKPYSCTVCSKKFSHLHNRNIHMRIHTGEKPYSCTVCSKKFTQIQLCKAHMSTHTGERPYSCTVCSKKFSQILNRNRHMIIHTGEKPFSCQVCSKTFAHSSALSLHKKKHNAQ